ncbi:hypothetical protein [Pseudodesulfovibrio sediminis]|uniref:Uncharacterized protein n=1 Tax=Pseudodesulfovibrio sediminis TaxID=2810563 RepID=A0ABN6EUH1_9BACT|nr:hypothetical protein [Pseudodesulfovibrio sediminis]BCS89102.1 hypothetical protein PSDVSF_23440 [Pseudodesulfovibrio sediminis]
MKALSRIDYFGIEIFGVEVFSTDGEFLDVEVQEMNNGEWVKPFIKKWENRPDALFSASYGVPERLLELFSN